MKFSEFVIAEGISLGFMSVIALLLTLLFGCSIEADSKLTSIETPLSKSSPVFFDSRLESLRQKTIALSHLREQVVERVAEYHRFGGLVANHNPYLTVAERYEIGRAILDHSEERGLDPLLVVAIIIVESKGRLYATSSAGALGLMQVMPYMATRLGYKGDLFVINENIRLGTEILAGSIERWGLEEGQARYFWGTRATPDGRYYAKVQKALEGISG